MMGLGFLSTGLQSDYVTYIGVNPRFISGLSSLVPRLSPTDKYGGGRAWYQFAHDIVT